jgi:hypothetical protein
MRIMVVIDGEQFEMSMLAPWRVRCVVGARRFVPKPA